MAARQIRGVVKYLRSTWGTLLMIQLIGTIVMLGLIIFVVNQINAPPEDFWVSWPVWRFLALIPCAILAVGFNARLTSAINMSVYNQHNVVGYVTLIYFVFVPFYEFFFIMWAWFQWRAYLFSWVTRPSGGPVGTKECPDSSAIFCKTDEYCIEDPAGVYHCESSNLQYEWLILLGVCAVMAFLQYMFIQNASKMRKEAQKGVTVQSEMQQGMFLPDLMDEDEADYAVRASAEMTAFPNKNPFSTLHSSFQPDRSKKKAKREK